MNGPVETVRDNGAWADARPRLSVLIPFLHDDPCLLLAALDREAVACAGAVELVLLEDGGGDENLCAQIFELANASRLPTRLVRLAENEGRSKGRNRLAAHARSSHLLFLDSDMLPDEPGFLVAYLALIAAENPAVAFGGFSVAQAPPDRRHALHRALAIRADCLPARVRALTPEKYVFTSNLLVRRDVFEAESFDETFRGWGWEDVEWGMRVARRFGVTHVDNTATHLGLDTAEVLAAKYEQSAANFARVVARHPEVVARYPSYRLAKLLKRSPARPLLRSLLKRMALASGAPLLARVAAIKAYRAALYAEVV